MGVGRELRGPATYAVPVLAIGAALLARLPPVVAVAVGLIVLAVHVGVTLALTRPVASPPAPLPGPALAHAPAPQWPPPAAPVPAAAAPAAPAAAAPAAAAWSFVRTGEYWTTIFGSTTTTIKDSKGMRYLHELLGRPGCEVHVSELVLAGAGTASGMQGRIAGEAGLHEQRGGGAGPMLDATAKAAYRRRLEDLRDTIEEARSWNDQERVARAEFEMDALAHELARAVGLSGNDRQAASEAERLRVNVTRAIRSAIERIGEHDAELAAHLTTAVRTGRFCAYAPDPSDGRRWSL